MSARSFLLRASLCCPLLGVAAIHAPASAAEYRNSVQEVGIAVTQPGTAGQVIESCLLAAASAHRVPPAVLVILLNVEGGRLGRVSGNTNATVDIGPMQINEIWLPELSRRWRATVAQTFLALRDNFCANVEAGAYILRQGLDEARGDFWTGVGYYHSHNPVHKTNYLRKVLDHALRLQTAAERSRTQPAAPPSGMPTPAGQLMARGG